MCILNKTKDVNFKVFNMKTRTNEAKTLVKHISCNCKCEINSTICNSNQKWNNVTCQCECKKYCTCKKDYSWNCSTCICENSRFLKSIVDTSVIMCNEIIHAADSVSENVINTIPTNVISTISINSDDKKVTREKIIP